MKFTGAAIFTLIAAALANPVPEVEVEKRAVVAPGGCNASNVGSACYIVVTAYASPQGHCNSATYNGNTAYFCA